MQLTCANVADEQRLMEVAQLRCLSTRKTKRKPITSIITMEEPN